MRAPVTLMAILLFTAWAGTAQTTNVKVHNELIEAIKGEANASAKYAKFAEVATSEKLPLIAKLFQATSKAESIHVANHKKVLEMRGVKMEAPKIETVKTGTTLENLADGIKGETYEFESMYPAFMKTAETADDTDAMVTYRYALESEKRHALLYKSVLEALKTDKGSTISTIWYVCPTCGNVYDQAGVKISCEFCGTLKPRYLVY